MSSQLSAGPVWICHQVLLTLVDTVGRLHGHLGLAKNFWVQAWQCATADSLSESRNWPMPVRPLLWELGHLCWRCFFGCKALQNYPLKTFENYRKLMMSMQSLCNLCLQNRPNELRGSTWLWRKRRRTRRGLRNWVKVSNQRGYLLEDSKEQKRTNTKNIQTWEKDSLFLTQPTQPHCEACKAKTLDDGSLMETRAMHSWFCVCVVNWCYSRCHFSCSRNMRLSSV